MSNKIGDLSLCDKHYGEYAHNHESVEWFEGLGVCQICLHKRIAELEQLPQSAVLACLNGCKHKVLDKRIAELESDKLVLQERDDKYTKTIAGQLKEISELQARVESLLRDKDFLEKHCNKTNELWQEAIKRIAELEAQNRNYLESLEGARLDIEGLQAQLAEYKRQHSIAIRVKERAEP